MIFKQILQRVLSEEITANEGDKETYYEGKITSRSDIEKIIKTLKNDQWIRISMVGGKYFKEIIGLDMITKRNGKYYRAYSPKNSKIVPKDKLIDVNDAIDIMWRYKEENPKIGFEIGRL